MCVILSLITLVRKFIFFVTKLDYPFICVTKCKLKVEKNPKLGFGGKWALWRFYTSDVNGYCDVIRYPISKPLSKCKTLFYIMNHSLPFFWGLITWFPCVAYQHIEYPSLNREVSCLFAFYSFIELEVEIITTNFNKGWTKNVITGLPRTQGNQGRSSNNLEKSGNFNFSQGNQGNIFCCIPQKIKLWIDWIC